MACVAFLGACGGGSGAPSAPADSPVAARQMYELKTTLQEPTGSGAFRGFSMSPDGKVIGARVEADGAVHAFVYDGASTRNIDVPASTHSIPSAVNAAGVVVVNADRTSDGVTRTYLTSGDGRFTDIGELEAGNVGVIGTSINKDGVVVGREVAGGTTTYGLTTAFIYTPGGGIATIPGAGFPSLASFVNDSGAVAGNRYDGRKNAGGGNVITLMPFVWSATQGIDTFPLLYDDGDPYYSDTGGFYTGTSSTAFVGSTVRRSPDGNFNIGWYWSAATGRVVMSGPFSVTPLAMSSAGAVVGYRQATRTDPGQGFVWTIDGGFRDVPLLPGYKAATPGVINGPGVMGGTATSDAISSSSSVLVATVWTSAEGPFDLNTRLRTPLPRLVAVLGIDDAGELLVQGESRGIYVLRPVN